MNSTPLLADSWSEGNYPPDDKSIVIGETNLPIVFIDTRNGSTDANPIHKDFRVAARMKIISNADGVNYGDTLAHPGQHIDYEGWVGIKYRGNTSFELSDKKPFGFRTLKTNDVAGKKDNVEILGMPKDNNWVMLAPYHDRSLIRDVLTFELGRPYFEYTPRMRYCEVILDGIYYGIYIIGERVSKGKGRLNLETPGDSGDELTGDYQVEIDRADEDHVYLSKYRARDKNGNTLLINNEVYYHYKFPEYDDMIPDHPEQLRYLQRRLDAMEDALNSQDFANPDTGYRQYIDIQSFIDQQLTQEFCLNSDAYGLSTNLYKYRDSVDARFKTALWDFNLAYGNHMFESFFKDSWGFYRSLLVRIFSVAPIPFWWARLMEDPDYVSLFKERWFEYRRTNYSESNITQTIDSLTTMLAVSGALERNFKAWPTLNKFIYPAAIPPNGNTYEKEINRLKAWIHERMTWMDRQLGYDAQGITRPHEPLGKQVAGYYNLQGLKTSPATNGPVIVRFNDGTSRIIYHQ